MTLSIDSPDFEHEGPLPTRFAAEGQNVSPALRWSGAPEGTHTLALLVEDPDAPDPAAPQRVFAHWIVFNLPVESSGLERAVSAETLPRGARFGHNDAGRERYDGPQPPSGRHRYYFKLYALDAPLPTGAPMTRNGLLDAIEGHVLGYAELLGTYEKPAPLRGSRGAG